MTADEAAQLRKLEHLRALQAAYAIPVSDVAKQAPAEALHSLRDATHRAPEGYRGYLDEAVDCYEHGAYRGAILMVWAATMEHIYTTIEAHPNGFKTIEAANKARFGTANTYRRIRHKNDLLHLTDKNFLLLCEDVGVFNKNARKLLEEKLDTRNRCGHPTGYVVGREETVVLIESLINNIISGAMMSWH
ncbi:hypothetical protein [Cellulomonas uda]|uniref:RiboL-PSP-HEPN domain-containing protein n=1 Tax=Cellulomonas uda TaxID=1714 RepID=A0A4Y3KGV9_CELUD|nr:hypothetical protein [Cellulomonas uda]NII66883.1 hypothetical protein [Cellulomonas uda]GEA82238.1 hypothetical protein CUD01_26820 [Cellulomonas uda]